MFKNWKIESRLVKKTKDEPVNYDSVLARYNSVFAVPSEGAKFTSLAATEAKELLTYAAVTVVGATVIVTVLKTACSIAIILAKAKIK